LPLGGSRDEIAAEGIACYRIFISGLLDITDNLKDGALVPPVNVVRHDDDDPYLVVAADKGTATFSDIANGIAIDYGFWLGDAFASGGSAGRRTAPLPRARHQRPGRQHHRGGRRRHGRRRVR
jgi:glutamate dehydrogenase